MTEVLDTPDKIRAAQLITAKHAIALEANGLRHSKIKGGVRGSWARHYGMPPKAKHLAVIARIQVELDEILLRIYNNQLPLDFVPPVMVDLFPEDKP